MCRSMVDIRSTAAEIRRGKKKKKERNYRAKIYMVSLLHRATIKKTKNNVFHVCGGPEVPVDSRRSLRGPGRTVGLLCVCVCSHDNVDIWRVGSS